MATQQELTVNEGAARTILVLLVLHVPVITNIAFIFVIKLISVVLWQQQGLRGRTWRATRYWKRVSNVIFAYLT